MFGGICRETYECFIIPVPDRTGAILWPIIHEKIAPGTRILSDKVQGS